MRRNSWWHVGCLIVAMSNLVDAQTATVPFVAGFERFARHQEITESSAGRLLLSELNCTACHASASSDLEPKHGPRLDGAGSRLDHEWMTRFILSPQKEKPGTTMPDILAGFPDAGRGAAARALAVFLSSLQEPFPEIKGTGARGVPHEFWKHGDADQGRRLYHQVGCVACHEPDEDYETVETKPSPLDQLLEQLDEDELKDLGLASATRRVLSVPHGNLTAKYSPQSLTFFLLDPHKTRTGGRMPNLKLSVVEAADIAAWLLRGGKLVELPTQHAQAYGENVVQTGRRLFGELGCSNCHSVRDFTKGKTAKPLADLNMAAKRSCVRSPRSGLPHFSLDNFQIETLQAALANERTDASVPKDTHPEKQLDAQLLKLNCLACHERNGQGGVGRYRRPYFETVGHVDIGDEGRLPPPLTAVGQKLQPGWMNRILKGTGDVRPHLRARMPLFPDAQVKSLPAWYDAADRKSKKPSSEKDVFGDSSKLAEDGRLLLDTGCVQCHPLRGDALPGVVGVDLEGIASRVQPQWFHDFLLNPGKLKPRTRMPTFFPNGKSQNATILSGDAEKQIAAMWAYLKNVNKLDLPPKIERARSQNYELTPKGSPVILRTFMEEAGTHAIAVGFPEKVHFAFDAEQVRLANAWRGRFLDAQGTWFVRFAPPADPLGDQNVTFPSGVPFAVSENASSNVKQPSIPRFDFSGDKYQFRGYRIGKDGVPTFLYRFGRFDVEDQISPDSDNGLFRQFTVRDRTPNQPSQELWFRGHSGKSLTHIAPLSYMNDAKVAVTVSQSVGHAGELQATESGKHWLIPLTVNKEKRIGVRYEW